MATYSANNSQKISTEIRTYTVDFAKDLPSGGTVTAGTSTHTPPSGTAGTITTSVVSPYIYVTVPALGVTGIHYVDVLATFSNGDKSPVRIQINGVYEDATCRSGMVDIVAELRKLTNTGPADYTIAGEPFWTDAQLEATLDRHYEYVVNQQMEAVGTYGTAQAYTYVTYYVGYEWLEQTTGGTATFYIQNGSGALIASADYDVDYQNGVVTFDADTLGQPRLVTCYSYDLNGAAAEIWRRKAGYYFSAVDFSTDNHSIKREQIYTHCKEQAEYFESMSEDASESADLVRSDDIVTSISFEE
jgi:hypothetical protein